MNGLKALAVACLVFLLASTTESALLYRMSYALLAAVVVCFLWSLASIGWVSMARQPQSLRAQVGETLEEKLTVWNTGLWPKLWLEVRDHSDLPGYQPSRVVSLAPLRSVSWMSAARCWRRGEYRLGPVSLSSGDPFGFFRWTRRAKSALHLLVYPATVDLGQFNLSSGDLTGGASQSGGPHQPAASVGGVREYVPGDSLSRIHWPSTARARRFIVKEFEFDPTSEVWLVLDLQASVQRGQGDDSTEEYGVVIAASLTRRLLEIGRAVGLLANANPPLVVPMDRGPRQLVRVLERLAVVRADGRRSVAELLLAESSRFDRSTTAIVVTPSADESWPLALRQATQRGARALAVFLEPASFSGQEGEPAMLASLAAANTSTYVVKKGDPLPEALARPLAGVPA